MTIEVEALAFDRKSLICKQICFSKFIDITDNGALFKITRALYN